MINVIRNFIAVSKGEHSKCLGVGRLFAPESGSRTGEELSLPRFVRRVKQRHFVLDVLILDVGSKKEELPKANRGKLTRE